MKKLVYTLLLLVVCSTVNAQLNRKKDIQIVRGPYLQVATDTSMVIRWRTNFLSRSRVRYGLTPGNLTDSTDDIELKTEHIITLKGLKPETKYYYSVGNLLDTMQMDADNYFVTLPAKGKSGHYRIGVFGDCGYLGKNQSDVRDQVNKSLNGEYMNAWLLVGDNAYNDGDDDEFQLKLFNPFQSWFKKYPSYATPGNHDYHDRDFGAKYARQNQSSAYFKIFSMPVKGEAGGVPSNNQSYYSFDIGNAHFISLDSYLIEGERGYVFDTTTAQIKWLKNDLEANRNAGWLIVFIHHPPYSKGTHDSDTDDIMKGVRENLVKIFERYKVDIVLAGHSHVYERSHPIKGHYGIASSFNPKQNIAKYSATNKGRTTGASVYTKNKNDDGIIYVVTGSAAALSKSRYASDFPHPAMYYSNDIEAGAGLLEINSSQLTFKWICADGLTRDQFTINKK